jgi:hypothetical protein
MVTPVTCVAEGAWDLWAQAPLDAAAPTPDGLALGKLPSGELADAIYGSGRVDPIQVNFAGPLAIADRAIPALFSTFHENLLPAPARRAVVRVWKGWVI